MLELIRACLISDIIILALLLISITIVLIGHFKREKKHEDEKESLRKSRDYHIKELEKRSGLEDEDLH